MKKKQMQPMIKIANNIIIGSQRQPEGLGSDKRMRGKKGYFVGVAIARTVLRLQADCDRW
ncbi:hypothetical protein ACFPPA_12605 [Rhodanobacter ginsengisoli]|uniref:Uncharacterized protein n=1 Tax=Rhodanobacter ginsengisoli TaxID=418646 RepID=A0ABW0QNM5_9GAMM